MPKETTPSINDHLTYASPPVDPEYIYTRESPSLRVVRGLRPIVAGLAIFAACRVLPHVANFDHTSSDAVAAISDKTLTDINYSLEHDAPGPTATHDFNELKHLAQGDLEVFEPSLESEGELSSESGAEALGAALVLGGLVWVSERNKRKRRKSLREVILPKVQADMEPLVAGQSQSWRQRRQHNRLVKKAVKSQVKDLMRKESEPYGPEELKAILARANKRGAVYEVNKADNSPTVTLWPRRYNSLARKIKLGSLAVVMSGSLVGVVANIPGVGSVANSIDSSIGLNTPGFLTSQFEQTLFRELSNKFYFSMPYFSTKKHLSQADFYTFLTQQARGNSSSITIGLASDSVNIAKDFGTFFSPHTYYSSITGSHSKPNKPLDEGAELLAGIGAAGLLIKEKNKKRPNILVTENVLAGA